MAAYLFEAAVMDLNQRIELIDHLKRVNGNTFISIDTETVPILSATIPGTDRVPNPHYQKIIKRQTGSSVMVFQNKRVHGYTNMITRRLIKEGLDPLSFKLSPRRWGKRVPNLPIVVHEDNMYLEVIFLRPGPVEYFFEGQSIDPREIIGQPSTYPPEQGGISNKVILRVFNLNNLRQIKINGEELSFGVET